MTPGLCHQVVVVGAGLAGLTAAHQLKRMGIEPTVLESASHVGGRMATVRHKGFLIDTGAQFLSTKYRIIPELARRCGLTIERIVAERDLTSLPHAKHRTLKLIRLAAALWPKRRALERLDLSNYSEWAELDTESITSWLQGWGGSAVINWVFEPLLEGLYFQQPETTSKALALMLAAFGRRHHRLTTLRGGMGMLPEALAHDLNVRCGEPVLALTEGRDHVVVETANGELRAQYAICATPAPETMQLWRNLPDDVERQLLHTAYSTTINMSYITRADYLLPEALRKVYGLLISRQQRVSLAAVGFENNKASDRVPPQSCLINVFLSDSQATSWMSNSDDQLINAIQPELERYLPGLSDALLEVKCFRWRYAEPRSPVGRAQQLALYRRSLDPSRRVILAGDYMSAPSTEGAAESGTWAANAVARRLTQGAS